MTQRLLSGKEAALSLNEKNKELVTGLKVKGITPCLGIIRIGERGDDIAYERGLIKRFETLGLEVKRFLLPENTDDDAVLSVISDLNNDSSIHGVLLFRPLPKHLDKARIENALLPEKDVDGMTRTSLAGVFGGEPVGYAPCTPAGCMKLLDHYGIDLAGKNVCLIGRSLVVGRPLAMLLMARNATVTICHTKTKDLPSIAKKADILVATAGKARMITQEYLSKDQIVIDVGINVDEDGNLCGDVDREAAEQAGCRYTPVPGGVGAMTTAVLAEHVIAAAGK